MLYLKDSKYFLKDNKMKVFYFLLGLTLGIVFSAKAQLNSNNAAEVEAMKNAPVIKYSRDLFLNSGDDKTARNLMVVQEVSNFKMGDEKLAKSFEKLKNNKNYNKKMDKIFAKLNNNKMRNQKNQQVINILNEAGQKIYNLMSD